MTLNREIRVGILDVTPYPPRTGGEFILHEIAATLSRNFPTVRRRFALNTHGSVVFYPFFPLCLPYSAGFQRKVDVLFSPWSGALPCYADMIYLQPPVISAHDAPGLRGRLGIGDATPRGLWPPPLMWLYYNRLVRGLLDGAALRTLDSVGTIIVASPQLGDEVKAEFGRDSMVIRPCLERGVFEALCRPRPRAQRKRRVLTISRIVPAKRLEVMVAIANELPKVEFVLAGQTGARSEDYIRKLTAANVAGNLAVRTSIDDLTKTQLLESSSVFLNTSVNETFGLTLLEAVLAGAYPIAHASGGPLEYLPAQHLFRTPEEAVHLIGNAIERELDVPADLVERARQIADPDRFERDIRAATEHAFLARRR